MTRARQGKGQRDRYVMLSPKLLDYVGRYTHRVAIANDRIRDIDHDEVRFTYKDYRADPAQSLKTMTLAATEFMRRFL